MLAGIGAGMAGPAGCDKVPLLAPSSATITLTISRASLPLHGSAEVTATVIEQGGTIAHNGTLVTFVSTLGTFDPPDAQTHNGRATSVFHAGGRSGTASLSAVSGGVRSTAVDVLIGAAAAERVVVRAEPTAVPVTGGTVQITAVVTDAGGNPLAGAQVVFSSDQGTLSSSAGITDANGEARVSLTTSRQTVVRAQVAGRDGSVTVQAFAPPLVTITGPTTPVSAGTPVSFTLATPAPPGNVTANPILSIAIDFGDGRSVTVSPGTASVVHTYGGAGTFIVTARATDSAGLTGASSTTVVVQPLAAIAVTLTASPLLASPPNPPNSVRAGEIVTFTATAGAGSPGIIDYQWNMGDGTMLTTTTGTAHHRFGPDTQFRTVTVTVRGVDGRTGTASLLLRVIP